jgi:hypothetical protein
MAVQGTPRPRGDHGEPATGQAWHGTLGDPRQPPATPDLASRLFWPGFAFVGAAVLLPFLIHSPPPLLDYPNHVARVHILSSLGTDPQLDRFYEAFWEALPNLAFDVVGVALAPMIGAEAAGWIFVVATVLGLVSGVTAISAQLYGKPRLFCLLSALFVFSRPLTYGFMNLVFGFAVALWGIALWLRLRERPAPVVLAWSVPFALVLYFCHLFAFGSYAVALLGIELAHIGRAQHRLAALRRAAGLGIAQAALPVVLLVFVSPTSVGENPFGYAALLPRLQSIALSPVRSYSDVLDILTLAAVGATVVAGFWTGRLRVAPDMRIALAVLAPLCLLVPNHLASAWNAETRLPVMLGLLFAASASWHVSSKRALLAGAAIFAALISARSWVALDAFADGARFTADVRRAIAPLPRGVRIASVTVTTPEQHRMRPAWMHAVSYAVIDRSAFVANLFTHAGQQPMRLARDLRDLPYPPERLVSRPGEQFDETLLRHLDYLLVVNPAALQNALPRVLEPVVTQPDFVLLRVVR